VRACLKNNSQKGYILKRITVYANTKIFVKNHMRKNQLKRFQEAQHLLSVRPNPRSPTLVKCRPNTWKLIWKCLKKMFKKTLIFHKIKMPNYLETLVEFSKNKIIFVNYSKLNVHSKNV
jgi:hypothetical protein